MAGLIYATHTARKQWRCDAGFTCHKVEDPMRNHEAPANLIEPGERYFDVVYPPWLLTQEDPDSPITPLGEWIHHRTHLYCSTEF